MPTYEYRCGTCTHQFEVFASMSDPDPEVCEACGASTLDKVLFPVAIHYKGSGFYSTDYSGSRASSGGSDAKPSDAAASSGGGEGSSSSAGGSGSSDSSTGSSGSSSTSASSND